jgi:hypothetical protein
MTEYAELSTEVKQKWQLKTVYTLPATVSAGVIPRKLHYVTRLTRFAVHDHTKICNLKCKQHRKHLGYSTVQQ